MIRLSLIVPILALFGCAQTPGPRDAGDPRVAEGRRQVTAFFGAPYPASFDILTFPDRAALDACAAQRWKMPPTQCWMVAMGTANVLVLLDPAVWKTQACEHDGS